jgi:replicative DNA helicase
LIITAIEKPAMPAHDNEAEEAILGAILLAPHVFDTVCEEVTAQDFYEPSHRSIFAAMFRLGESGHPIDHITISDELKRTGELEGIGGSARVAELIQVVAAPTNVGTHCRIVREQAQRRNLRRIGYDIYLRAGDEQQPVADLVEHSEGAFLALDHANDGSPIPISDLVNDRLTHLEMLNRQQATVTGVPTGFRSLDKLTAGLHPGTLNIIAARTAMGKTALALSIAAHVALREHRHVQIYSLEMSKEQLTDRLLSMVASVDSQAMRRGQLTDAEKARLASAGDELARARLHIDDTGGLTLSELRRRARRLKAKHDTALLIVDYLQLMTPGFRAESRQQEVSDISRRLKILAKELGIPVLALSQLNRKVEGRDDKRPVLSDLRESGAIEQDADLVAFIYRDEVNNLDSPDRGIAEILIRKQRSGPVGELRLLFREQYVRFEELP